MKQTITLGLLAAFVLGLPLVHVGAQEEAVTTDAVQTDRATAKDRLQNMKENAAERKEHVEERKMELDAKRKMHQGEITAEKIEKIVLRIENAKKRMSAMGDRLLSIADRIDSRIAKLSEKGIDTTAAIEFIADARVAISHAQSAIAAIDTSGIADAEELRVVVMEIKEDMKAVKSFYRDAHTALKNAVVNLKASNSQTDESNVN